jgi:excisionase family DNA binding protein
MWINPVTLRRLADDGKIPVTWVGNERRFSTTDLDAFMGRPGGPQDGERLEGLYVRVSGASGQETSVAAQEAELRATATGTVAKVFRDRSSGLREDRPGLEMLAAVACGKVNVVQVTHEDRLARFGAGWLRQLLAVHGATLEVLHPKVTGGRGELLEDFMSLVTTFAGRLYGLRPAESRRRLIVEARLQEPQLRAPESQAPAGDRPA